MRKITATILKEWQLMKRDIAGLLLLLVMPAALIIVMALIQDAPFQEYQDIKFQMLIADADHGSLARQITDGLKQSPNFRVTDSIDGKPITEDRLKELINSGDYKIGIVIPAGVTAEVANAANLVVNEIARKTGMDAAVQPAREVREQVSVRLYFDPVSKPAFRSVIGAALDKYMTYSCSNTLMSRLALLSKDTTATTGTPTDLKKIMQGIGIKELPVNDNSLAHVSSVQHNVPAWAIFGMFFIVIPISGHVIKEREDGSADRIALIPNVTKFVGLGKIIFYTLLCTLQFTIMMGIGLWAMPVFGLPSLYLGQHAWLLLPIALLIGFAASTYGYFFGTFLKTINQSLSFGSVSVVILSAVGGIWVPIEIMPASMQRVAMISPLHWSLEAVNEVILRNGDMNAVVKPLSILLITGTALWVASFFIKTNRERAIQ